MTRITIRCPITWEEKYNWIKSNCVGWEDRTYWGYWRVGLDDICIMLRDEDAVLFRLKWGQD